MDIAAFRANFPEFADTALYTDAVITFWSGMAEKLLVSCRWGTMLTEGIMLATAHYVTLAIDNLSALGISKKLVSSEGVGDVSASYDVADIAEVEGGEWNATNYGRQFLRLARMFGMGGVVV